MITLGGVQNPDIPWAGRVGAHGGVLPWLPARPARDGSRHFSPEPSRLREIIIITMMIIIIAITISTILITYNSYNRDYTSDNDTTNNSITHKLY